MFSSRLPAPAINRLSGAIAARKARGEELLDLTVSNPTAAGLAPDADRLAQAFGDSAPSMARYAPDPRGHRAAREIIAQAFQLDADDLLLCSCSSEAYGMLFKLLCNPRDGVLVPRPSYPLFEQLTALEGVEAVPYRLHYDGAWRLDLAAIAQGLRSGCRAVLVVNPNNPTGSFIEADQLCPLADLLAEHDAALIGDEVFFDYAIDAAARTSVLDQQQALAFSLGGLSKWAGLPQMKLSWIALGGSEARRPEAMARLELIADTYLCLSTPVQAALSELLAIGAAQRAAIKKRIAENITALSSALEAVGAVTLIPAQGGWTALLRVPALQSEEELVVSLVQEAGVLVHPGYFFDFESEAILVLSLLVEPSIFSEGLSRLLDRFRY